jgi:hypothetical protein
VQAQQSSDLAVEIHLASLDARAKERALAYFQNLSRLSKTIRVDQPPDQDTVANFDFSHGLLVSKIGQGPIKKYATEKPGFPKDFSDFKQVKF